MALRFDEMSPALLPSTLEAVRAFGFDTMTPVQNAAIPLFSQNKDVAVEVRFWQA
jgi:superfamily II DNA/RNA helicase